MDMKLKSRKGIVTFIMRAGKDFVRNTVPVSTAEWMIENAKAVKDERVEALNNEWYRCTDNTYFFPLEEVSTKKSRQKEDAR